jgi:hypothetical protein
MTLVDSHRIDDALTDLVAQHVLTPDQAMAVSQAVSEPPEPSRASPARARLVEAAAYLGAVLVGAGVLALVIQSWESMTVASRIVVVVGLGAVSYAVGLAISLLVGGGRATLRQHAGAPRRRVGSVLLTVGAVLVAAGWPVSADGTMRSFFLAALTALALLVPAQRLVPSALTELALFGASAMALAEGLSLLVPERPPWDVELDPTYPPARAWDYLVPGALLTLGVVWAAVVSRALTLPVVAQVVGLLLALESGIGLAVEESMRPVGLAVLALLAVIGIAGFVRERGWPWLALTVLSATFAVFVLVSDAANPALAFLLSGVVLLASAGGATMLGRRKPAG